MSPAKKAAKRTAVASIHEEDFSLDDLTVEELEKLRDKCESTLAKKLTSTVPLTDWYYDEPDDRSYGQINFKAKTVHGVLEYEGSIGSDGAIEEAQIRLWPDGRSTNDGADEPDFDGFERRFLDLSEDEAQAVVVNAILEWAGIYNT